MSKPLPFQVATIEAVIAAFEQLGGSRRFLVADEVGLGKTIVAQGVVDGLIARRRESGNPLKVFYVCNSLAIARQNMNRLLEVLPEARRKGARCTVDRLTLMPGKHPQDEELHLYSLTPSTSLPRRKGQPRKGRVDERALVRALLAKACPSLEFDDEVFRFGVQNSTWEWAIKSAEKHVNEESRQWFSGALRWEFFDDTANTDPLEPAIRACFDEQGKHELMGRLRNALAAHVLRKVCPDLVIMDEFQRFRDLLARPSDSDEDSLQAQSAARLLRLLRGDDLEAARPSLLLLSATPYRLLTDRDEDQDGGHHSDFFEVLEFLAGHGDPADRLRQRSTELFRRFREGLQAGTPDLEARDALEDLLAQYMARTERSSHELEASLGDARDRPQREPVAPRDLAVFRHFSSCLEGRDRGYALPYWTSVPHPAQTLGAGYKVWESLRKELPNHPPPAGVEWSAKDHEDYRAPAWAHPGLRALLDELPPLRLSLPWLAPSRPWWPLHEEWREDPERASKLLVFSRFRAVPPAVAAALSFEVERWVQETSGGSRRDLDARLFTPTAHREAMLALWFPSPTLAAAIDPATCASLAEARSKAEGEVRAALESHGIRIEGPGAPQAHGAWRVLAALDGKEVVERAWKGPLSGDKVKGLSQLVDAWLEAAVEAPKSVGQSEVDWLVEYSFGAPGVVLARALGRYARREGEDEELLGGACELAWNGLRTYLDHPWFHQRLLHLTGAPDAPSALRRAVVLGNLESVLDEHLWILVRTGYEPGEGLREALASAFALRAGEATFHELREEKAFRVRCHAALPFTEIRDPTTQGRFRTEELRDAFNSPFWPYVLVTTSVGQEGLDFHLWCRDLLHWDLPSNPVDLEQREGRIRRFGGLAVRRALAERYEKEVAGSLPWQSIAACAERDRPVDDPGLQPWWIQEGALVRRHYLDVPLSERRLRLESLKRRRLLYRLVLGQPDQEDLLADLEARGVSPERARKWALELSPYFRKKRRGDLAEPD